jgi:hypothetical protein
MIELVVSAIVMCAIFVGRRCLQLLEQHTVYNIPVV